MANPFSIDVRYDTPMNRLSPRIVLASQSPRRRRLLEWLGIEFDCSAVDTPEELDSPLANDPPRLAMALATEKALAARALPHTAEATVLCFDTIVVHGGHLLGKPTDAADAMRMLRELSGQTHHVVTGCTIACPDAEPVEFAVVTDVTMHDLDDDRIAQWMAQGTYLGCAGAYNIEAQVARVTTRECYQNVAGLPLCHLHARLSELPPEFRPAGLTSPIATCDAALGRRCELGREVTTS